MSDIERWWQVRRADKRTHWSPEDPLELIAAGKAPAWEDASIVGPYVPEADLQRAVARADEAERELRVFKAGLTDVLRAYNVPAMPSWPEAIHWLARHGRE